MIDPQVRILKRPVITEKATGLKTDRNQVLFEVSKEATKPQVKVAIEKAFKVKVLAINSMIVRGKLKRMGRYEGKRSSWKKVIATLRPGDNIEVFEGV